jgi:hypothetical protein
VDENPYEAPEAASQERMRKARLPLGGYTIAGLVVVAVLAAIALIDLAIVKVIEWESKSRVHSAPDNSP